MNENIDKFLTLNWHRCREPVSMEQIYEAELRLELSFSEEYRQYLHEYGAVSFYGHELTGICSSKRLNVVDVTMTERKYTDVPDDWYVLEQGNIDGIVIWQATNGSVYLTAPGRKARKIADSLFAYIKECDLLT